MFDRLIRFIVGLLRAAEKRTKISNLVKEFMPVNRGELLALSAEEK